MHFSPDTFTETVSSILERKVRGWLVGVIDDMRRSSPVQQWLDSLPSGASANAANNEECELEEESTKVEQPKSDDSKAEETLTENTVIPCKEKEDEKLDVPNRDTCKRKSLESGILTSTPQRGNLKRLQRDHSIQSEGYSTKLKNPLLRDASLQVIECLN